MNAPMEWRQRLERRELSQKLALASLLRAADVAGDAPMRALLLEFREASIHAFHQERGGAGDSFAGDRMRDYLTESVLPRLAADGFIVDTSSGDWRVVRAKGAWFPVDMEERRRLADELTSTYTQHFRTVMRPAPPAVAPTPLPAASAPTPVPAPPAPPATPTPVPAAAAPPTPVPAPPPAPVEAAATAPPVEVTPLPAPVPQAPPAPVAEPEEVTSPVTAAAPPLAEPVAEPAKPEPAAVPARGARAATQVFGASLLEGRNLVKSFKGRRVVDDVTVAVRQGEIVGLLGPNGAGKTTTFYMLVGLIRADGGQVLLDGARITRSPMYRRARQGIGYLAQEPSVFRRMTVEENVRAILERRRLPRAEANATLERMLDELSIKHLRKSPAYSLSGGERRRLEITRALVGDPKFMLLDEPFAGVDPIAVHDIQTIVAGLRHRGIGVLITDHNVEQTLDIVDRAYIMFEGKVQASGTVTELVHDERVSRLYLGPTLTARLRARLEAGV